MTVTAYTFVFGSLGAIPFSSPVATFRILTGQPTLILSGVGIALFCTVLPYIFYTWGLKRMETGKAAILVAVEPLVGALIGILLYKETHDAIRILWNQSDPVCYDITKLPI